MPVNRADSAAAQPFPPAPLFGCVHHVTPPAGFEGALPAWQPPADLAALHRPALIAGLLQRVLSCIRDPVQHLAVDGLPALYVLGIALLIREQGGCVRGFIWGTGKNGQVVFKPIPPNALTVHPCPAGMHWLRAITMAFGSELLAHLRLEPRVDEGEIVRRLEGYLDALQGWLQRQLQRHADLRAMRTTVARALALDADTLHLARHIHRDTIYSDAEVSAESWNTAIRHKAALCQLRKELPQALPLYAALLANEELPAHAANDAVAILRRHLLQGGVHPAVWRLLTRSSVRLLLAVRQMYSGPLGQAVINHLLVLQQFRLTDEPPAEIIESIWSRQGNTNYRWPEYLKQLSEPAAALGHIIRRYTDARRRTPLDELAALRESMHTAVW